jgi:ParB-like chromosome segregation protein Spo0J
MVDKNSAAEWIDLDSIIPWDRNPRKNDAAAKDVARAIIELGWGPPIVAWRGRIIAGHTRHKAAKLLREKWRNEKKRESWSPDAVRVATMGEVPVRSRDDLTEHQANIMALADNKLGEKASWDNSLADILSEFSIDEAEIAGWAADELSKIIGESEHVEVKEVDVSDTSPEFWLSIRGPLPSQPEVLEKLHTSLGTIEGIQVTVGVVK